MTKTRVFLIGLLIVAQPAFAQSYEGRYRPAGVSGEGWDCKNIGIDGGALAIANGAFFGVESRCSLANATAIRDMDATLFDMVCMGEGETWTRRVMLMSTQNGIAIIENGGEVSHLARCE